MIHIEREIRDFVVVTRVSGEIDLAVMDDLREGFAAALALTNAPFPVIVDLQGVSFLSSGGLDELLRTDRKAREMGSELRIVATRREIVRPLELTGLLGRLDVRRSVEDALAPAILAGRR